MLQLQFIQPSEEEESTIDVDVENTRELFPGENSIRKRSKKMKRVLKPMSRKLAQMPGSLIHIGEQKMERVKITHFNYSPDFEAEKQDQSIDDCGLKNDFNGVCWWDISGIHDVGLIDQIGKKFDIHSLTLEDILNTNHRPKMEDLEKHIFLVLKMLSYDKQRKDILIEHVSFILGNNYVLTFQEEEKRDVFDPVRSRIRTAKGRIRKLGADYLLYSLMDTIIDNYFRILENLGEDIEQIEDRALRQPTSETISWIHRVKREVLFLRKIVWPLRDILSELQKSESDLLHETTDVYWRDLYDHVVQIIETTEIYRDMVSGIQELYLSSMSNKLNEVMKVLTIIATIFIPLTFIAGVYGMNFESMPEIKWRFGYFFAWVIMVIIGAGMIAFFKRKKWF